MLTPRDLEFIKWWEANRLKQKKWFYQLAVGLPFGLLIGVLIITNFSAGWHKRAEMVAGSGFNPLVLYIAVAIIVVFIAVFSKKFQWDQQEQRYKELSAKKAAENSSNN